MAPKPPDQKRKRGRPPGAPKPAHDASRHEAAGGNDEEDAAEARPKKRGRPARKSEVANTSASEEQGSSTARPLTRGRPRKGERLDVDAEVKAHPRIRAKGARSSAQEVTADETTSSGPRRSGRERRLLNADNTSGARRPGPLAAQDSGPPKQDSRRMPPPPRRPRKQPENELGSSSPRRSGRERRSWDAERILGGSRQGAEQEDESIIDTRKAKPEKQQGASQEKTVARKARKQEPTASNDAPKKRGRQPRLERNDSPGDGSSPPRKSEEPAQPRRRGRPKASSVSASDPDQDQPTSSLGPMSRRAAKAQPEQNQPSKKAKGGAPRKTERPEPDAEEVAGSGSGSGSEGDQQLPFRHLKETIRTIPRSTIDDNWAPLDPLSINLVSAILVDAQRPVLLNLQDTNRRRQLASAALVHVSQRLRGKLIKGFPFPAPTGATATRGNSGSYEEDFDFERTMDANQTLENTLNPLLHSVSLLQKEIQREEDALANEYSHLRKLETNAKYQAKEWKEKARREHVLAPGRKFKGVDGGDDDEPRDHLELVPALSGEILGGLFKDLQDEELLDLSKQIGSHMESLRSNLQQVGGVVPAITKSKAALQQVLLKHLDDEQYESILLG